MMRAEAEVIAYEKGIATVQCFAQSACGGCASKGCGTKALSALAGEKKAVRLALSSNEFLVVGDRIEIGLPEQTLLVSVFWLYLLPLFSLIGSALVLSAWLENELWVAFGVLLSTLATFYLVKIRGKSGAFDTASPVFLRKL